jgi:hypothetical protein
MQHIIFSKEPSQKLSSWKQRRQMQPQTDTLQAASKRQAKEGKPSHSDWQSKGSKHSSSTFIFFFLSLFRSAALPNVGKSHDCLSSHLEKT